MEKITINDNEYPVYCSIAEADTYFSTKLNSSKWTVLSETDKAKVIIEATRQINRLKFAGFPVALNQPLAFPRYFKPNFLSKRTYTSEANTISVHGKELIYIERPEEIIAACCEQSVFLAEYCNLFGESVHIKNQRLGITSINIGAGSVSYSGARIGIDVCPEAKQFIEKFLIKTARVI